MVGSLTGTAERPYDFLRWALDAVVNPANPTQIVCRATIPGATFRANAASCVPLDIFGNDGASQAAIDFAFRSLKEDSDYKQDVVGVNFRSNIAQGWAGPIAFATGVEWRSDKADTTHDIPNQPWYSSYFLSYGLDRGGTIDVLEAYGEVQIPMSKKLQTDFALRETHNESDSATNSTVSGSHDFSSWKASAIYDALQWLRFRATVSQDVRAAGFRGFLPRVTVQSGAFPANVTVPVGHSRLHECDQRPILPDDGRVPGPQARDSRYVHAGHRVHVRQAPLLRRLVQDRLAGRNHPEPRQPTTRRPMLQERRRA